MYKKVDYTLIDKDNAAEFLIVSVTKVETDAILDKLQPISADGALEVEHNDLTYYIGKLGLYNVVCCKCKDPGTIGPNTVTITVVTALQDWPCVKGVFMPGICYGLKEDEQHRSDVIASQKVFSFDYQEVGKEAAYKMDKRKTVFTTDAKMLSAFELSNNNWNRLNAEQEETKVAKGNYITGNKKFTDTQAVKNIAEEFPHAVAGDMEGQGLAMACIKFSMPWLLMKGISDFGGRDDDDAESQKDAASASVEALLNILNNKDAAPMREMVPDGSFNYFYHELKAKLNDIFFVQYLPNVENYYIERSIDKKLNLLIKTGGCWVFGGTGVGKSVSITRALTKNQINYVLCDLGRHSRSSIDEIFKNIYTRICLKSKVTPIGNLLGFDNIAEEIFKVVKQKYEGGELYILIEEIPFDFGSEKFLHFVDSLNSLIISSNNHLGNIRLEFIISTIDSPEPHFAQWQAKIKTRMKFINMNGWSPDDCLKLVEMLSRTTNLIWTDDLPQEKFIELMEYSPARIKKFLNDVINIGVNEVSKELFEIIGLV